MTTASSRASTVAVLCTVVGALWFCVLVQAVAKETPPTVAPLAPEQPGPWLRVYPDYVVGLYADGAHAEAGKLIPLSSVLVELGADSSGVGAPRRLVSFESGKTVAVGCRFDPYYLKEVLVKPPSALRTPCQRLIANMPSEARQSVARCLRRMESEGPRTFGVDSFVSSDYAQTLCLVSIASQFEPTDTDGFVRLRTVWMGEQSFLGLEKNRIFDCGIYGPAVDLRSATVPSDQLREARFPPPPLVWSLRYLIKTSGFIGCWGGRRAIDTVWTGQAFPLALNDGTALLPGSVSVLRVRVADGSTDAPPSIVKVLAPQEVERRLEESVPDGCDFAIQECELARRAGYKSPPDLLKGRAAEQNTRRFNAAVIRGIDKVLQSFFE